MKRTTPLRRKTPLRANGKPMKSSQMRRGRPKKRPGHDPKMLAACKGQPCWLILPGVKCAHRSTVVPCHANWAEFGKGMGLKAADKFTVPGCANCHRELDQGKRFTKEEKRQFWSEAYRIWSAYRDMKIQAQTAPEFEDVPL